MKLVEWSGVAALCILVLYRLLKNNDMGYWEIFLLIVGSIWILHMANYRYQVEEEILPYIHMLFYVNCVSIIIMFMLLFSQQLLHTYLSISYEAIELRLLGGVVGILLLNFYIIQLCELEEANEQLSVVKGEVFINRACNLVKNKMWINRYKRLYDGWTNLTIICGCICLLLRKYIYVTIILIIGINSLIWVLFMIFTYGWKLYMVVEIAKRSYKSKQSKLSKICEKK